MWRSLRRHHRFRMRRRAARLIGRTMDPIAKNAAWIRRQVCRRGDNYAVCSDPICCGNPRRLGYRTRSETAAAMACEEDAAEVRWIGGARCRPSAMLFKIAI